MKRMLLPVLLLANGINAPAQAPYKFLLPADGGNDSSTYYITTLDNPEVRLDSAAVIDGVATFRGTIDEPVAASIPLGGRKKLTFVLESGTMSVSKDGEVFGSPLNDQWRELQGQLKAIADTYPQNGTSEQQQAVEQKYNATAMQAMYENLDNPLGYMLLTELAYDLTLVQLEDILKREPSLADSRRISRYLEAKQRKASTDVGQKYKDFEVNGHKLSQYVGADGKYLLVDFWASWCGPCRREIPVIKDILAENADKLNVLGVAVWDEPEATARAVKQLKISWPVIDDAQTIPTDIYGILGIPCIMLIAPDGTIVVRDQQGDALKDAVSKAIK